MTMIGNRFNSLKINVKDPFSKAQPQSKKGKTAANKPKQSADSTKSPIVQIESKQADKNITASNQPNSAVILIKDLKSSPPSSESAPTINKKTGTEIQANVTDIEVSNSKDDRGSHNRSTYKKMIVSGDERMFDRHSGPKNRVKPVEKKHGHGSYNWGDQMEVGEGKTNDSVVEPNGAEKKVEAAENVPQVTLGQFKEYLRDNKVDPLSWSSNLVNPSDVSTNQNTADDFDVKQYMYRSNQPSGKGRRGNTARTQRPSERPRRDNDDQSRERFRGQPRREGRPKAPLPSREVRVDDKSDFPEINQYN